jgi:aspartate kinase
MAIIVQKFGGTSVATLERIRICARLVKDELSKGNHVAVVVSAMAGVTDLLVSQAGDLSKLKTKTELAEYDQIVASGEQVASGLLALALQAIGINARSWLGWQLPLNSDDSHGSSKITTLEVSAIRKGFAQKQVAVLAGFQGRTEDNRISTLGRGGSDTSAVALAAALGAERCDIYTDVEGVYTTDPRIVTSAKKLAKISYEEMLEMAALGAKVLQTRSVEMAMKYHVPIRVLSSFSSKGGTYVTCEEREMEKNIVTGIAYSNNEARVTVKKLPDDSNSIANVFSLLSDGEINVDMIVQNISEDSHEVDITFTIPRNDLANATTILNNNLQQLKFKSLTNDDKVAKISLIGLGMRSHSGVAKRMFKILADKGIRIMVISTSEIKISVLIAEEYTELAMRALHTEFDLDGDVV